MQISPETIKSQELVEISRSAYEASQLSKHSLRFDEKHMSRYFNPPADTPFPLEYAYHLLGDIRDKSVLDLGCGSGGNTIILAWRGASVTGLDISEDLLEIAKKRMIVNGITSDVALLASSAYNMNVADESVDIVFGMSILHHLELSPVSKEVKRVLRKGGRAIFLEPVRNSKFIKFVRSLIPYKSPDVSEFERPLTDQELREFADGFSQYNSKAFSLPYINLAYALRVSEEILFKLYRLDGAILKKFPFLGHYASLQVIEIVK